MQDREMHGAQDVGLMFVMIQMSVISMLQRHINLVQNAQRRNANACASVLVGMFQLTG